MSCNACYSSSTAHADCVNAYAQADIVQAHWECWSQCNLHCPFCYRSRTEPLHTPDALRLLSALRSGGIEQVAFAGGDPSLRADLPALLTATSELGMRSEVQTNSQFLRPETRSALLSADLVGLSLDGGTAESHDQQRRRRGNFQKVIQLAELLDGNDHPFVIRTVISASTDPDIISLGPLLSHFRSLHRWSLVQFSAIEDGFVNRLQHEISTDNFRATASRVAAAYTGPAEVNIYPNSDKVGVYFLIASDGTVYADVGGTTREYYSKAGNILHDHASHLASLAAVRVGANSSRYRSLFSRNSDSSSDL